MTAAPASRPASSAVSSGAVRPGLSVPRSADRRTASARPATRRTAPARTNAVDTEVGPAPVSSRGTAVLIAGASIAVLTAVCGVFLITDVPVPPWAVFIGRWIPALVALAVLVRTPVLHGTGRGALADWWGLCRSRDPEGRARPVGTIGASAGAAAGVILIAVVTALLAGMVGAIELRAAEALVTGVLVMLPLTLVFAVSTLGEEVVWRAHLPRLLGGGFWAGACLIAGAWAAFHVPLHLTYVLQGAMPASHGVAATLGLVPLSLFLSAAASRWGSVWPAVIAHAVPFSALTLAADPLALDGAAVWTVTGISAALFLSAAMAIAPVEGERRPRVRTRS